MKKNSNSFILIFVSLLSISNVSSDTCKLIGPEAVDIASSFGFQFTVKTISEAGHCRKIENGSAILLINNNNLGVTCEATFFSDLKLDSNWKIINAPKFSKSFHYIDTGKPKYNSNNPKFTVRVSTEDADSLLELKSITLEGPNCKNWKSAFRGAK